MVVMTTGNDELMPLSGWTDDEIRADDVRAAGVLYAAATLDELKLIELTERLNELNQQKMLNIGAGASSNALHVFWDAAYKRMPPKRRLAIYARVVGSPGAPDDVEPNAAFGGLLRDLVAAIAEGPADEVGPAASELHENLAEHTDEASTKAAVELRATFAELAEVLSDVELRAAFPPRAANDMWELIENVMRDWGSDPSAVADTRTLATSGAAVLRALPELAGGADPSDEVVAAAERWLQAAG
jgi:hypothetical protein